MDFKEFVIGNWVLGIGYWVLGIGVGLLGPERSVPNIRETFDLLFGFIYYWRVFDKEKD